jgi:hypothetical protein
MLPTAAARLAPTASSLSGVASSNKQRDLQPVLTFGKAAAACHQQAKVYGACILAQYESVEKGMCEREFGEFKNCVQSKVSCPYAEGGVAVAIRGEGGES